MKKKWLFVLIAIALVSGLALSCGDGAGGSGDVLGPASSSDDFQGRWVSPNATYTFTGSSFLYQDNVGRSRPGTFTFTAAQITFIPEQANTWTGYTLNYQVSGTTLMLTGSADQTSGTFIRQPGPMFVAAKPDKGFNYGYYYYIPSSVQNTSKKFLLVQPNNSGMFVQSQNFGIDDAHIHNEAALQNMYGVTGMADELGTVLLVPAIPRPRNPPPNIEPQVLDRVALQTNTGTHARVDLQLIKMIDDLKEICRSRGINLQAKILINGYSASGNFGNRFTAIHPELVQAVVSGGINGRPILPVDTLEGERLIYPVGIADIGEITGKAFNLERYKAVPQFIYMGANDTNQGPFGDEEERRLITKVLGAQMMPGRWERSQSIYNEQGINVTFRTYAGAGHEITPQMTSDTIAFLRGNMR